MWTPITNVKGFVILTLATPDTAIVIGFYFSDKCVHIASNRIYVYVPITNIAA